MLLGNQGNEKTHAEQLPWAQIKRGECVSQSANGIIALIWKNKKDVKMLFTKHNLEMLYTGKKVEKAMQ